MAKPKIKHTITKKEWNKKHKDFKMVGKDGIHYIMMYDDKIGTYLAPVKIVDESIDEGMFSLIDQIRDESKNVKDFIKKVLSDRNFSDMKGDREFIQYLGSIYESVNEKMDLNDPMLVRLRAAQIKRNQAAADRLKKAKSDKEREKAEKLAKRNATKIKALKKKRAEVMRDMEQEAEPEGGKIADRYGKLLNKIDNDIIKLGGNPMTESINEWKLQLDLGKVNPSEFEDWASDSLQKKHKIKVSGSGKNWTIVGKGNDNRMGSSADWISQLLGKAWKINKIKVVQKEGKKRFKRQDGIGKAKYTISYHDGKKKHKDGSDFFDIKIFKNKKDLSDFVGTLVKQGYKPTNESVNEANAQLNKKVKKYLDDYLRDEKKNSPEHQEAIMLIMRGALTDANFHSEARQLSKYFPKAKGKFIGTPMEDVIEDKGIQIANWAKWDGYDIIDAFAFYTSMSIGGSFGAKFQSLKEESKKSVNEASDLDVYHKSYTHAIEAAKAYALKKGYQIEDDEMFTKVGMNSKRPSVGKTTRVSLELMKGGKPQRKMLHVQVYGMKNGYELNAYIN